MQQLSHKNPWKTALVIVGFVFLTAALSTAGWFYHYSPLQQVPPPSAQTLRATRPVARIMADPQAAMAPVTGTPVGMAKTKMASETIESKNKAFVLEAFDTLFNKRDYAAAERFWSPNYIQHSAHIPPGREGLFALVRSVPETMHYENQLIVAEGDYVIAHGRFSGIGRPAAWIAADVIRFEDGVLKEHWDVLQDEATKAESVSGLPMFGDTFPG